MVTLHHLRIGRSIFTVWLLEEVGVDYQLKVYHRNKKTLRAQEDLREIHPLGKSPVIEDEGQIIAESGSITAYILEKYDTAHRFHPPRSDLQSWATYNQWLHYAEGSAFAPLLMKLLLMNSREPHQLIEGFSDGETDLHLSYISDQIGDKRFLLGETLSGADFGVSYVVSLAQRLGLLNRYDRLQSYLARNMARPAFQRAVAHAIE